MPLRDELRCSDLPPEDTDLPSGDTDLSSLTAVQSTPAAARAGCHSKSL